MKLIFVFLFTIFLITCKSQPYTLEGIIAKEGKAGDFSGSVLIAKGDSIILIKSAGYADKEQKLLNDSITKFNIASTGKLFTRIVILQLAFEGKLGLNDTIGKFFQGFNQPEANKITVYDLLDHKSGLGDILVDDEYMKPENFSSMDNVVRLIAREKPAFTPGTDDKYSNSGYYLLSAIIARVTGKSFAEAVTERIFKPLGMVNSGFGKTGEIILNEATPYKKNGKKSKIDVPGEPPSGAGSEYSTVMDLFMVYESIIKDNKLLTDESKGLLFNHFQPVADWNKILKSRMIIGYLGGDTRGWSAKLTFMFNKETPYCVVILSNFDGMAHPLDLKLREIINKPTQ